MQSNAHEIAHLVATRPEDYQRMLDNEMRARAEQGRAEREALMRAEADREIDRALTDFDRLLGRWQYHATLFIKAHDPVHTSQGVTALRIISTAQVNERIEYILDRLTHALTTNNETA